MVVTMAVAGLAIPAVRATDVAAAMVKARVLFTCARKTPPGEWDGVEWSVPAGVRERPPLVSAVCEGRLGLINVGCGKRSWDVWFLVTSGSACSTGP
ncbi:polyribonucleotide nucleotidyltransferase [Streptomyces laurentii]|uniref:Polyribonucleotide nucleotidyltransferase n=1 Tax=Streptomyces laurentii TaxID=39478 RepID=A0A160P8B2_STRLU|nr:polyribonucleotide nucleotidyltransferase [Streptomyces laurentii]